MTTPLVAPPIAPGNGPAISPTLTKVLACSQTHTHTHTEQQLLLGHYACPKVQTELDDHRVLPRNTCRPKLLSRPFLDGLLSEREEASDAAFSITTRTWLHTRNDTHRSELPRLASPRLPRHTLSAVTCLSECSPSMTFKSARPFSCRLPHLSPVSCAHAPGSRATGLSEIAACTTRQHAVCLVDKGEPDLPTNAPDSRSPRVPPLLVLRQSGTLGARRRIAARGV